MKENSTDVEIPCAVKNCYYCGKERYFHNVAMISAPIRYGSRVLGNYFVVAADIVDYFVVVGYYEELRIADYCVVVAYYAALRIADYFVVVGYYAALHIADYFAVVGYYAVLRIAGN